MNRTHSNITVLCFCAVLLASCSKKKGVDLDELASRPERAEPPPASTPAPVKKPEPPKYAYPYDGRRDPFMPLVGTPGSYAGSSQDAQTITQSFSNLELKGILKAKSGKIAMISATNGETYMLKSGRVFDRRNRVIHGVSGIIKENSVVLISQNKTVKELVLVRKDGSSGTH